MIDKQKGICPKTLGEEDKRAYEHTYPGSSVTFESFIWRKNHKVFCMKMCGQIQKRTLIVSVTEEKGVVKASAYSIKFDASHYTDGSHYGAMNLYTSEPS